ncbi:membrane protein insertion efficiency factor YidD [Candidatus Nomurabacteria bacterium]|nr:membrane protein insertion efficiency factor YidD [Candidatus Nomurabacteria bacterium]
MTLWGKLRKLPNSVAIVFISLYRTLFSPSVGLFRFLPFYSPPSCIFYPTCSEYGKEAFKKYPFLVAFKKTVSRIRRCHPGNDPRVDLP